MVGVIAGGIAVLLYAPKSGREMREMLKDELNETQCMFQNWSNDLNERVNRFGEIVRFKAEPGQISSKM
jgi:gas vesicle protein